MKKLLLIFSLFAASCIVAQAPQYLNYQGVARDASGTVINSGNIGIRFEIWRTSPSGTKVYQEEMSSTPSAAGIFTTAIGSGSNTIGTFSSINWANGPYFIVVGIDPTGGTSFSTVGASQLLSVPYALYAETAGNTPTFIAGNGIAINSGTIINSAPNKTVGIGQSGIANVLGAYPNYTVDVAAPNLNYNTGTQVLTLTQGSAVTTATITGAASGTISMFANGIATVTPVGPGSNFTVSVQTPSFTGAGSTTVTGTYPNYLISTPPPSTAAAVPLNIQINPPHTTSTLSPGNFSINVQPTTLNGVGVASVSGVYPNFTVGVPPPSISSFGNTLTITQGTATSSATLAGGPWIYNTGVISPAISATTDRVGIGQNVATSLLDINNTPASGVTTSPVVMVYNSNPGFGANGVIEAKNAGGSGAIIYASSTTSLGDGIAINMNNTSNTGAALRVNNVGSGNAGYFAIVNGGSTANVIDVSNNGSGNGITSVITNSTSTQSAFYGSTNSTSGLFISNTNASGIGGNFNTIGTAVYGTNSGAFHTIQAQNTNASFAAYAGMFTGGMYISGKGNSSASFALKVVNSNPTDLFNVRSDGNVGIGVSNPGYRLSVFEPSASLPAIYGSQGSAASSAQAHGVYGLTSNSHTFAAGVLGENNGSGPGIFGYKNGGSGPAGRFEQNVTGNSADAVFVFDGGLGAGVHIKNGATAGASNVGVIIEDGHIGSISASPPTVGGTACTACLSASLQVQSNDIAGTFTYSMSASYGATYAYTITFNKPYRKKPIVVASPVTQIAAVSNYYITIVGVAGNYTGFTINWPAGISAGAGAASYNYIVIESSN